MGNSSSLPIHIADARRSDSNCLVLSCGCEQDTTRSNKIANDNCFEKSIGYDLDIKILHSKDSINMHVLVHVTIQ